MLRVLALVSPLAAARSMHAHPIPCTPRCSRRAAERVLPPHGQVRAQTRRAYVSRTHGMQGLGLRAQTRRARRAGRWGRPEPPAPVVRDALFVKRVTKCAVFTSTSKFTKSYKVRTGRANNMTKVCTGKKRREVNHPVSTTYPNMSPIWLFSYSKQFNLEQYEMTKVCTGKKRREVNHPRFVSSSNMAILVYYN